VLDHLEGVSYIGPVGNGRTKPCRLEAVRADEEYVEVVAKFSDGCERGVTSLAVEAICACLACDLNLPMPEPFTVSLDADLIAEIPDIEIGKLINSSDQVGFATEHLPSGYATWARNHQIHPDALCDAFGVFIFDCFIQNIDRLPSNPNCITNGTKFGIFDHEISLNTAGVLFWRPPWETGGLQDFASNEKHLFFNALHGNRTALQYIDSAEQQWQALSSARIQDYGNALPPNWIVDNKVQEMLSYLDDLRSNLTPAFAEIKRILV